MTESTLYHNPRCSKSRQALALLAERGVTPHVVEYLRTPPDKATLRGLLRRLGLPAHALVRQGEEIFKTRYRGRELSEEDWLDAMVGHPILIERPIFVHGDKAVIGRPPEKVLDLL